MGSDLFYKTCVEVMLGDRVQMHRWFRKPLNCYIPGLSTKHAELEDDGIRQWAVRADDGTVYPILYDPQTFQPPAKIEFVSRGETGLLDSEETLV